MNKDTDKTMMLNKLHIRNFAKERGKRISKQAINDLSTLIRKRIRTGIERMGSRKTIMWDDII